VTVLETLIMVVEFYTPRSLMNSAHFYSKIPVYSAVNKTTLLNSQQKVCPFWKLTFGVARKSKQLKL